MKPLAILLALLASTAVADPAALAAINAERAKKNRTPLVWDARLEAAAQAHADDMVAKGYFSHDGLDGSNMADRMRRRGFDACFAAENIAQGQKNIEQAMASWMGSKGHRRNILHRKARAVAVARGGGNMWVMLLGAPC